MMKEKCHVVLFSVWSEYSITVVWTSDVAASRSKRNDTIGEVYDGQPALGMHSWIPNKGGSWLFFNHNSNHGTIAHECWHAIYRMLKFNGAEMDNETVAYHLGYLVEQVYKYR